MNITLRKMRYIKNKINLYIKILTIFKLKLTQANEIRLTLVKDTHIAFICINHRTAG